MNTKNSYREYFADVQRYVKITKIIDDIGENRSNYSKFMKGPDFDFFLSIEKCQVIENAVKSALNDLLS